MNGALSSFRFFLMKQDRLAGWSVTHVPRSAASPRVPRLKINQSMSPSSDHFSSINVTKVLIIPHHVRGKAKPVRPRHSHLTRVKFSFAIQFNANLFIVCWALDLYLPVRTFIQRTAQSAALPIT
jgi:hypothetical protein